MLTALAPYYHRHKLSQSEPHAQYLKQGVCSIARFKMSNRVPHGQKKKQKDLKVFRLRPTQNSEVTALTRSFQRLDTTIYHFRVLIKIIFGAVIVCRAHCDFIGVFGRSWSSTNTVRRETPTTFQYNMNNRKINNDKLLVPQELLQPFGAYPNLLNITQEMRRQFHPVIQFPMRKNQTDDVSTCVSVNGKLNETYDYIIKDHTGKGGNIIVLDGKELPQLLPTREEAMAHARAFPNPVKGYDVGRYDEDRCGMYTSSLFEGSSDGNNVDMRRTLHVGIDIGAPVGTEVHAFVDGIVQSVGYNPDIGDYGHVIVIEHSLPTSGNNTKVYALYGHLAKSVLKNRVGDRITKGQIIGHIGNTDENGGWVGTHLHFQVAVNPPEKDHDMPGVVRLADRHDALLEYIDPRYILSELY